MILKKKEQYTLMSIFVWVIFGFIAGAVAHMLDPKEVRGGLTGSVLLGITGAVLGGFLANAIFGTQILRFDLGSFVLAVASSLLLLFVYRASLTNPDSKF